ncbi:MAG: GNAT family N-acetyltransferase [Defluviitaleaceae bacterium]|nr:GNAT family N-acetyltransferase [Defluviitaleaceae bacterium]
MIELRPISILSDNVKECIELELAPEQISLVSHNAESLAHAYIANSPRGFGSRAVAYAIYADDKMVGFVMYGYFMPEYDDDCNTGKPHYHFWRFMVDKNHQGKGYGRAVLTKIIEEVRTKPCGEAEIFYTSYEPDNPIQKLYHGLGFEETGQVSPGGENIAIMKI